MKNKVDFFLLLLWSLPLGVGLSMMLGLHFASVKKDALTGIDSGQKSLLIHHFLSTKCSCSKNIIEHLMVRKALPYVVELVHLVHPTTELVDRLKSAGFEVESVDEEEAVRKYNLQSLPQLVVSRGAETLYQGGYGPDQQHRQVYGDDKIIAHFASSVKKDLAQANSVVDYPIFGCANGKVRKQALDLLGLKYGEK